MTRIYIFRGNDHPMIPKYCFVYRDIETEKEEWNEMGSSVYVRYQERSYKIPTGMLARIDNQPHFFEQRLHELISGKHQMIDRLIKQNEEIAKVKEAKKRYDVWKKNLCSL